MIRSTNWPVRALWAGVIVLAMIGIAAVVRRGLYLAQIVEPFINPEFGPFDAGFARQPVLTWLHIVPGFFAFSDLSLQAFFGIAFWLGFTAHLIAAEVWINYTRPNRKPGTATKSERGQSSGPAGGH